MRKIKNITVIQIQPINRKKVFVKFPVYWYYLNNKINKNNPECNREKTIPHWLGEGG